MISSLVSRSSAALLAAAGFSMLFAADAILPRLVPGFPPSATWIGQLLAGAWLGIAALNWLHKSAVLGGIYGRPIVMANLALYFISALVLLKAASRAESPATLYLLAAPAVILAIVYGALLLRGPLGNDLDPSGAR
jgi:predicted neutral ceramidase superfamily lipid hydrolase